MSNYYKIGVTRPSIGMAHPFKIDIGKKGKKQDGTPQYTLAVNYHSRLYVGMKFRDQYLSYEKISITGLDFVKLVPQ